MAAHMADEARAVNNYLGGEPQKKGAWPLEVLYSCPEADCRWRIELLRAYYECSTRSSLGTGE